MVIVSAKPTVARNMYVAPARSVSTGRRQDTGFAVYSATAARESLGDASPHSAPSRRQARQAKPSAALDTFMSVQVRVRQGHVEA